MARSYFDPDVQPLDLTEIESTLRYLTFRVNYHIRRSLEYPAVLPGSPYAHRTFILQMLSVATEHYTESMWQALDDRLSALITEQTRVNAEQSFRNAELTLKLLQIESPSEGEAGESDTGAEALAIICDIDHCRKQIRKLGKDLKKQTQIHEALLGSPAARKVRQLREELKRAEDAVNRQTEANEDMVRKLKLLVKRRENEISLLEGELNATTSRVDLAILYTTEDVEEHQSSFRSSMISSVSGIESSDRAPRVDLGISVTENLF